MTLDEAIKHAEEVAEEKDMQAGFDTDYLCYQMSEVERNQCKTCAEEHRQLAEWLKELKANREQEPISRWIPVSERLPEEYGEYLITWKNPKYPKTYIGICECEITDVYDHEHNRFEVEWLFDGYITTAYPDSKVIAWMPLPKPYEPQERSDKE
jgi:hypothetical protein